MSSSKNKILKSLLCCILLISFVSCAGRMAFKKGAEALVAKDCDAAVEYYLKAVQKEPDNPRYRMSLAKALIEASNIHYENGKSFTVRVK